MITRKLNGVLFDLYGTLLVYGDMATAWQEWISSILESLQKLGVKVGEDKLRTACTGFFSNPDPPGDYGQELTLYERRIGALGKQLGVELTEREISDISGKSVHSWARHTFLDPQAQTLLNDMRSTLRIGLISNFDHPPHVHSRLADLELIKCFDTVVVSGEVGIEKPDPGIFSLALGDIGLAAEEVAFVGDSVEDDIKGSEAIGMTPILIDRQDRDTEPIPRDFGRVDSHVDPDSSPACPDGVQVISSLEMLRGILM